MSAASLRIFSALITIVLLLACRQETPAPTSGTVESNAAYRAAFGQPPAVQSGKAYARVGYLPLKEDPARVAAVPLFIYEETGQLPRILRQLVGGVLVLPPNSPLHNPFPASTAVRIDSRLKGDLVLSLDVMADVSFDAASISIALAETALQYEDIDTVTILFGGQQYGPYMHDPQRIAAPASPNLVMIAGIWDAGEDDPEEIVANFDRPVKVNSFRLAHKNGEKVAGEYYTSVFQMAVVVHPEKPQEIREGQELTVTWQVTDALDRVGSGQRDVVLERFVHAAELGEFRNK